VFRSEFPLIADDHTHARPPPLPPLPLLYFFRRSDRVASPHRLSRFAAVLDLCSSSTESWRRASPFSLSLPFFFFVEAFAFFGPFRSVFDW